MWNITHGTSPEEFILALAEQSRSGINKTCTWRCINCEWYDMDRDNCDTNRIIDEAVRRLGGNE